MLLWLLVAGERVMKLVTVLVYQMLIEFLSLAESLAVAALHA